jgi:hypothetical protein
MPHPHLFNLSHQRLIADNPLKTQQYIFQVKESPEKQIETGKTNGIGRIYFPANRPE